MRLVADIGGTNARFALSPARGRLRDVRIFRVRDFETPLAAIRSYLGGRRVRRAVLAVATPVEEDEIRFTNNSWRFSRSRLARELGLERLAVINDTVAHASALPHLGPEDVRWLLRRMPEPQRPAVLLAPGTGLGLALLVPWGRRVVPFPSEGGHVSFAPVDELETEILRRLQPSLGHVSNERLLSGPGLLRLARILAEIRGRSCGATTPLEVTEWARSRECVICVEAVQRFSGIFGSVAGDTALMLGARGGIYLGGGLLRALGERFDEQAFARRFGAKGRLSWYLERIPVLQVLREDTALLGASWHRFAPRTDATPRLPLPHDGGPGLSSLE